MGEDKNNSGVADGAGAPPAIVPCGGISIEKVSKRFRKHTVAKKSYSTIKTTFLAKLFQRRYPRDNFIEALRELSLYVPPGASVGLIGSNGSGKSTLLKLISGIYRPDSGAVKVNGKISALIELGAGFHPDFTGRENIYLGGVMYGLTKKEIESRIEAIIRYAELEDFIDDPVRTYSSGMYMRLGFSLAVHTDPDILLIDEVLAVGDAGFIHRCHDTISEFKRKGKTLIFVTHDLSAVERWCDEAIWLEKGYVRERGEPRRVIDAYIQNVEQGEERKLAEQNSGEKDENGEQLIGIETTSDGGKRWGSRDVEITDVKFLASSGEQKWLFHGGESLTIEVSYRFNKPVDELVFGACLTRADGLVLHGSNTEIDDVVAPLPSEAELKKIGSSEVRGVYRYKIERLEMVEGSYYVDVAVHKEDGVPYDYHYLRHKFSLRTPKALHGVYCPKHSWEFSPQYNVAPLITPSEKNGGMSQVQRG